MTGTATNAIARKYALTRLGKGDYLLLANDGKTLWRIATYTEDGSAMRDNDTFIRGVFWGTWVYRKPLTGDVQIDRDDWSDFDMDECLIKTRSEAVQRALWTSEKWAERNTR